MADMPAHQRPLCLARFARVSRSEAFERWNFFYSGFNMERRAAFAALLLFIFATFQGIGGTEVSLLQGAYTLLVLALR